VHQCDCIFVSLWADANEDDPRVLFVKVLLVFILAVQRDEQRHFLSDQESADDLASARVFISGAHGVCLRNLDSARALDIVGRAGLDELAKQALDMDIEVEAGWCLPSSRRTAHELPRSCTDLFHFVGGARGECEWAAVTSRVVYRLCVCVCRQGGSPRHAGW
jgi:hypothetical protein